MELEPVVNDPYYFGDMSELRFSTEEICERLAGYLCPAGEPWVGPDAVEGSDHGHTSCYFFGRAIKRMRDLDAALRRAVETKLRCAAAMWLKNTKTGEPYEWTACDLAPGHDCPHAALYDDGNHCYEWSEGLAPVRPHWPNDTAYVEVFSHTVPSPWTDAELRALAAAGGTYDNSFAVTPEA